MPLAFIRRHCLAAVSKGRPQVRRGVVPRWARPSSYSSRAWGPCVLQGPVRTPAPQLLLRRSVALGSHMTPIQIVTSEFLSTEELPSGTHLHLIVLNYVLPQQTAQLWNRATTRICADGGANRLYDQIVDMLPGADPAAARNSFLPDLIKGDLDSVRPDVQEFYTSRGVPMIDLSSDQETTDLEKCLLFLEGRLRSMSGREHTPAATATQQQQEHAHNSAVVAATAAVVSGNGMGHGASAIGAVNATKAPDGAGAHSSSKGSSTIGAWLGSSSDAEAAAASGAVGTNECHTAASTCGDASYSTAPQQETQQHGGHEQHYHHDHRLHWRRQQQQQQQEQKQHWSAAHVSAAQCGISGRIVMLETQLEPPPPMPSQYVQQEQPPQHPCSQQRSQAWLHNRGGQQGSAAAAGLDAATAVIEVAETNPPLTAGASTAPSSHSMSSTNSSAVSASGNGCAVHGAVHQVHVSVLASWDGSGEAPSKRLQQEHIILVLGALGGRLDHTLSNLNTLYCYRHLNMALWGDGNLVRLLRAGRALIKPSRAEGPTCGLVPLARPATASSTGLKWDLDNTHMCFRGLLSTSNIINSDTITVNTDEDLLWITAVEDTNLHRKQMTQQQQKCMP